MTGPAVGSARASARSLLLAATFVLAIVPELACSAQDASEGSVWRTAAAGDVAILHHPDDASYAARVASIVDERGPSIARSMGLAALSPLRVVVASTDDEFVELSYYGAPDWGVGCALPRRGLVVLKSPRIVDYPLQMETVVEHELAHIAAGRVLRGIVVPRWFDEGVAQAVAGEWRMSESGRLAAAAASGRLPPLSAIEERFPEGSEAASMAYAMSFRAVRLMMDLSRTSEPGDLVVAVSEAGDFDRALKTLTGLDRKAFEAAYARFVSRRFNWGTVLNDGRWMFLVAALLFVAAALARIRRARARMRSWEEEELEAGQNPTRSTPKADTRWN